MMQSLFNVCKKWIFTFNIQHPKLFSRMTPKHVQFQIFIQVNITGKKAKTGQEQPGVL